MKRLKKKYFYLFMLFNVFLNSVNADESSRNNVFENSKSLHPKLEVIDNWMVFNVSDKFLINHSDYIELFFVEDYFVVPTTNQRSYLNNQYDYYSAADSCETVTDLPYTENFDTYGTGSEAFPDCWERPVTYTSGSTVWPSIVSANSVSSPGSLKFQSDVGTPTYAVSPSFEEDINNLRVRFSLKREGVNSGTIDVGVMSDPSDTDTFELVQTIDPEDNNHTEYLFNLNTTTLSGSGNHIAVRHNSNLSNWYYWLDNFVVELLPSCLEPTEQSVDNITTDSVELSWTSEGLLFDIEVVEAGEEPTGTPTNTGVTNPYTVTDLEHSTTYEYYVRRDCGEDDVSSWTGPYSFTTLCEAVTDLPYTENFDTYGTGSEAFPDCWERPVTYTSGSTVWPSIVSANSVSSPGSLKFQSDVGTPTYAVSPSFEEDINNLRVRFSLKREGVNSGTIDVGVMSDPSDTDTFELVQTIDPEDNNHTEYLFNLNTTTLSGSGNHIAVRHNSNASNWYYWLDNFVVELLPSCLEPTEQSVDNITTNSAELSWTSEGLLFDIEVIEAGEEPTGTPTNTGVTNPYTVNDLEHSTTYEYYVRRDCGEGDVSSWTGPYSFTTLCEAVTDLPYIEDFEDYGTGSEAFPDCWERPVTYTSGSTVWPSIVSYQSGNRLKFQSLTSTATYAVSPSFEEDINNLRVRFSLKKEGVNSGTIDVGVMSVPSDMDTFELVQTIDPDNTDFNDYLFYLDETTLSGGGNHIAFRHNSDANNYYYWLDDFVVELIPSCIEPLDVTLNEVSENSITVTWNAVEGQDTWQVLVLPEGSLAPDEDTVGFEETSENPYTVEGLEPNTDYVVYVRSNCGEEGGVSFWTGPAEGRTTQIPAEMPYEEDFEGANNWGFLGTGDNQWEIGTAVNNGGASSLYISNDNGITNAYTITGSSVAHAYRDIVIPEDVAEGVLSFDWRAMGEACCDYVRVWLVPTTFSIEENTQITAGDNRIQIGQYNQQAEFNSVSQLVNLDFFAGGMMRLVFEWRNDGGVGTQPPAAIDNINMEIQECPGVLNIGFCEGTDYIDFYWEQRADEQGWEIALEVEDLEEPDQENVVFVTEPEYLATDLGEETTYYFYLRTVCEEGVYGSWQKITARTSNTSLLEAEPFCAGPEGIIFPNVWGPGNASERDVYGRVACLANTPSPVWYFLKIKEDGDLIFDIIQRTEFNPDGSPAGTGLDVDFVAFGPFEDLEQACKEADFGPCPPGVNCASGSNNYPIDGLNIVDCNYSAAAIEEMRIMGAQAGQIYAILITNYKGDEGFIKLVQKNIGESGAGTTDCDFLCEVDLGEDKVFCEGEEYELKAKISSAGSTDDMVYTWFKDGEMLDPEVYNTTTITVTESGVYKVLVEKDMCEENPTDEVEIRFLRPFEGEIINEVSLCDLENEGYLEFDLIGLAENAIAQDDKPETLEYFFFQSMEDMENSINEIDLSEPYFSAGGESIFLKIKRKELDNCWVWSEIVLEIKPTTYPVVEFMYESPICVNNLDYIEPIFEEGFTEGGRFTYKGTEDNGLYINKDTGIIDVANSKAGRYTVTYTYTIPSNECGENKTFDFDIEIFERFNIAYEGDCVSGKFVLRVVDLLQNINMETASFLWTGPKGFSSTGEEVEVKEIGEYSLLLTTEDGCFEELEIDLSKVDCMIQKGISPNGDGLNDSFDLSSYKVMQIGIYNRYGVQVFSYGSGYTNEWYGQDKSGNQLPDGTYFYEFYTPTEVITGWIQINR